MIVEQEIDFLHILPANTGRTYRFIKFMHEKFDCRKHVFFITSIQITVINNFTRLLEFSDLNYLCIGKEVKKMACLKSICKRAKRVIWHSLYSSVIDIPKFLSCNRKIQNKSCWVENGFDINCDKGGKTFLDELKRKKEKQVRSDMKYIASIFPLNADIIRSRYNKDTIPVCYPPNENFYSLPDQLFEHEVCANKRTPIIQVGTDTRVFSRIKQIIKNFSKQKQKRVRKYCVFLPSNVSLHGDESLIKCNPEYIREMKQISSGKVINFSHVFDWEGFIHYQRTIDALYINPSVVLYPEYLLAPIFCGVNVYFKPNYEIAKYLSGYGYQYKQVGILNLKLYSRAKLGNSQEEDNVFTVFSPDKIKAQWECFFQTIS